MIPSKKSLKPAQTAMKFLGIDYGAKRIGIALSDDLGRLAFPKVILNNDKDVLKNIRRIIAEENAGEIVIGESANFKGQPNKIAQEIEKFIVQLKDFGLPIRAEKEFLTSVEARRYAREGEKVDASAAALILQRYLDRINLL